MNAALRPKVSRPWKDALRATPVMPALHPTRRRAVLGGLAAVTLGAASSAHAQAARSSDDRGGPLPSVGSRLPVPDVTLLDGRRLPAASLAGHVTVLYWWASWCPFCAIQSPEMHKLWATHAARGLRLLGLSIDRKPEDAQAYLTKKGYGFPSAWVSPELRAQLPKPRGLPVTVVLGRDGRVLLAESGQMFAEDVDAIADWL